MKPLFVAGVLGVIVALLASVSLFHWFAWCDKRIEQLARLDNVVSHSIIIGHGIEVTNAFELAFGDKENGIYRTRMSVKEFETLTKMVRRAVRDDITNITGGRGNISYGDSNLYVEFVRSVR